MRRRRQLVEQQQRWFEQDPRGRQHLRPEDLRPGSCLRAHRIDRRQGAYETALTFKGSDTTKPLPQLTTYSESPDNKVLTLTLNGKHTFSVGKPRHHRRHRLVLQAGAGDRRQPVVPAPDQSTGKPLDVAKTSSTTMTITDPNPNPALPFILPNPSLGVLDSKTRAEARGDDHQGRRRGAVPEQHLGRIGPVPAHVLQRHDQGRLRPEPALRGHQAGLRPGRAARTSPAVAEDRRAGRAGAGRRPASTRSRWRASASAQGAQSTSPTSATSG